MPWRVRSSFRRTFPHTTTAARPPDAVPPRLEACHLSSPIHGLPLMPSLWGLQLIDMPEEVETLVMPGPGGGRSLNGIRRRMAVPENCEVVMLDGLRVTSMDQTIRDLAAMLPLTGSLPAADRAASFWGQSGRSPEEFGEGVLSQLGGLSKIKQRRVQRVLAAADPASGSPGESLSLAVMILAGLPKPAPEGPAHPVLRVRRSFQGAEASQAASGRSFPCPTGSGRAGFLA